MSEIEEVRQQIILAQEDFGAKALAYFDSLNLDRKSIHTLPQHLDSPYPGIRGSKSLDKALQTDQFFKVAYEVALHWPGYDAKPVFCVSIGGDNRDSNQALRGYIGCGRGIFIPNPHDLRNIGETRFYYLLLGEMVTAYNALFNGNGK